MLVIWFVRFPEPSASLSKVSKHHTHIFAVRQLSNIRKNAPLKPPKLETKIFQGKLNFLVCYKHKNLRMPHASGNNKA